MAVQPGILDDLQQHGDFLLLNVNVGQRDSISVALRSLHNAATAALDHHVGTELTVTIGFGITLVNQLAPRRAPKGLRSMPQFLGDEFDPFRSQTDLFLQICSTVKYANYDVGKALLSVLAPVFTLVSHHQGFRFPNQRGVLGFLDGTGNPSAEEKPGVALIGREDLAFHSFWASDI